MNDTKHDRTVLIIEDDPDCRDILSDLLYGHGYEIACAENGRRALDYLKLVTPSLILLDLAMPVMNGRVSQMAKERPSAGISAHYSHDG
jgi:CheY-like chemotaxis protein